MPRRPLQPPEAAPPPPEEPIEPADTALDDLFNADRDVPDETDDLRGADPRDGDLRGVDPPEYELRIRRATRDPHLGRRTDRVQRGVPLATYGQGGDEHALWDVSINDTRLGRPVRLGTIGADATEAEFVEEFYDSMPQSPDDRPVTLSLSALSATGEVLAANYRVITFHYHTRQVAEVRRVRAAAAAAEGGGFFGGGGGLGGRSDPALALVESLQRQLAERDARDAERAKAVEDERRALMEERITRATMGANDVAAAHTVAMDVHQRAADQALKLQTDGFSGVLAMQQAAAASEANRLEARLREDRERAQRELDLRREELKLEREKIAAEAKERAERDRAERQERLDREERERRERLDREAQERREKAERDERMAKLERDTREAQERRDKEHREFLARMDTETRQAERERLIEREKQQDKMFQLQLELIRAQNPAGSSNKLGVLGELLESTGLSVTDVFTKGKEFVEKMLEGGATSSLGSEVVRGLADIGKEIIKRLPAPGDGEEEEEEEEEEAEDERPQRRIAQQDPIPPLPPPAPKASVFDAILARRAPDEDEDDAEGEKVEKVEKVAEVEKPNPEPPADPEGEKALRALVEELQAAEVSAWPPIVTRHAESTCVLDYLKRRGVDAAMRTVGAAKHAPTMRSVLTNLGLL
jgi:hypothetical protein